MTPDHQTAPSGFAPAPSGPSGLSAPVPAAPSGLSAPAPAAPSGLSAPVPAAPLGALGLAVLALISLTQSLFFPWFPALRSPNELARVYLAEALVEDGDVRIDGPIARHGPTFDVSVREVDGERRHYSDKAPGLALLTTPLVALHAALTPAEAPPDETLATRIRLMRLVGATLPTLLLCLLLLRFLSAALGPGPLPALLTLAYGLGTVATPYASLALGHQLSALLLFALYLAVRRTGASRALATMAGASHAEPTARPWSWLGIGALAGCALCVEYQNAILTLPFAAWFLARVHLSPRAIAWAALGALPPLALLLTYHQLAFGSPFLTGYSFIASSFAEVHAQGLLGVSWPRPSHAWLSFLSPAKGLFFFAPWLAFALPGLFLLGPRPDRRFLLGFILLYALFVSAMVYPSGGWTVSQRHLAPAVPFMVLPAGLALARTHRARLLSDAVWVGLAGVSIFVFTVASVVWPYPQEHLENPFWQLVWPLFRDGWVPRSTLSFMASWWLLVLLLAAAGALLLGWLAVAHLRRPDGRPSPLRAASALGLALLTAATFVALARRPGASQDVGGDRAFVERVYVPDPRSNP